MSRTVPYLVLRVQGAPYPHSALSLWTIEVRPAANANAPATVMQVESASPPYATGAVVDLCPDWMMTE